MVFSFGDCISQPITDKKTIIEVAIAEIEFDCITDFEFELYSWLKTYYGFGTPKIETGMSIDFDRVMEAKYE